MIGEMLELALGIGLEVAREKKLAEFIPDAVEIARSQGWVSPHRLANQRQLTLRDARFVLFAARRNGVLLQARNGRFYTQTESRAEYSTKTDNPRSVDPDIEIFAELDDPLFTERSKVRRSVGRFIICISVVLSFIVVYLFFGQSTSSTLISGSNPAHVQIYSPPVPVLSTNQAEPAPLAQHSSSRTQGVSAPLAPERGDKRHHGNKLPSRKIEAVVPGELY